jgi:serine/threonine protein phosphatase PrpC
MKVGAAEINGRSRNPPSTEDRHFIQTLPGEITIAGVFDGHGGLFTVVHTLKEFPTMIENMLKQTGTDTTAIEHGLKEIFITHDKNLAKQGYIRYRDSGSTATIAIITPSHCIIAHIGDSPACIFDASSGECLSTIEPHLPSKPKEKERILKCKGTVTTDEGDAPRVNGTLMVSRAFGDFSMKFGDASVPEMNKNWATDFCVIALPDIKVIPRSSKGVLAIFSDGLIDTANDELKPIPDVCKMIKECLTDDYTVSAQNVLKKHMAQTESPYEGDDTTVILIDISLPPPAQSGGVAIAPTTRKARRVKRVKKQTKRVEGLKTFTI